MLHSGTRNGAQKKRNDWESSQLCENVEGHKFARSHQVCKTMSPDPLFPPAPLFSQSGFAMLLGVQVRVAMIELLRFYYVPLGSNGHETKVR